MTITEIKQAIDDGNSVELYNGTYEVIKDSIGQYLIKCKMNANVIGLHGSVGTKYENVTNYPIEGFYIVQAVQYESGTCPKCSKKYADYQGVRGDCDHSFTDYTCPSCKCEFTEIFKYTETEITN